jgi:hypothetical protein
MPAPPPVAQIRVTAGVDQAAELISRLTAHARALYGPHATYHVQRRTARRAGHARLYLTVTRKENHAAPDH